MPNEINEKIDGIASGIKTIQEICDRNSGRLDSLDEKQIDKISDSITKTHEEVSSLKSQQEKLSESMLELEKALNRPGQGKGAEQCSISKEANNAFVKYLRNRSGRELDPKAIEEIKQATVKAFCADPSEMATKADQLVVGINPNAGYLVRPEFANFVSKRQFETSPMRQIADVMTVASESLIIPLDDDEPEVKAVGEIDPRTKTDVPTIGEIEIHTHENYANQRASQRLLDDAVFPIETWLQDKLARKFTRVENTAFVTGSGNKSARGFLNYDAWSDTQVYERFKLGIRNSGSAGTFTSDNLIDLQSDLYDFYQPNATWVMHRKTFATIMKFTNDQKDYLLNINMLREGAPLLVLGRPVRFFSDMPIAAADSKSIGYGDFREGYQIIDRLGLRILVDPYTAKPYIQYVGSKRYGGAVKNFEAIKLLKLSA
jgi:HK97 family phage major capsid protein